MRITTCLILLSFLLLLSNTNSNAQVYFEQTYGGSSWDELYSGQQTYDNGYVAAGYTMSFGAGSADYYLVKLDVNGDTVWTRAYGGTGDDVCYSVYQTSDSGYVMTGYSADFGPGQWGVYVIKTDENGDTLWTKAYDGVGDDGGSSISQTTDGGYIITGYTSSYGAGGYDVYLIRTDAAGDTVWTRTYGGGNWDWGNSVQQTFDGGFIIAGMTMSYGVSGRDLYLIKTDSNGDTLWTRTYGGTLDDEGFTLWQTPDSGYIIVGNTENFGAGNVDVYLLRTDAGGDTLWTKTYGGNSDDYGYSVQLTSDGGYIIGGMTTNFGAGLWDAYLLKTNASGDTLWTRAYGSTNYDWANGVSQSSDGGYLAPVSTGGFGAGGTYNGMLLKVDSTGNAGCNQYSTATETNGTSTITGTGAIVGSGGIVSSTATVVSVTATVDSTLCLNCDSLAASFFYIANFSQVSFFDSSLGATGWYWDFDDGNTDSVQNPTHTYGISNTYYVCLIVSNPCGTDTVCDSIMVNTGIDEFGQAHQFIIYPNPSDGILNVYANGKTPAKIEVFNTLGKVVLVGISTNRLDISNLLKGVYLLKAFDARGAQLGYGRIVKQ